MGRRMHFLGATVREWWHARPRISAMRSIPPRDLSLVAGFAVISVALTGFVSNEPLNADGAVQLEMARSFASTGEFRVGTAYAWFYPPLYPLLLVVPGMLFGFTPGVVHGVQASLLAATVVSTFLVASSVRRSAGLLASAFVIPNSVLLAEAGTGRATILAAFLFLWLFHFVRTGVSNDARLGWAGIVAGLLYLTKDTAGYVAVLGILIGLAWRASDLGWAAVLRSPHYLLGGGFFLTLAGAWALRNEIRFGSPVTNPGMLAYSQRFFLATSPDAMVLVFLGISGLFAVHWLSWSWPALLNIERWPKSRPELRAHAKDPGSQSMVLFLLTTLILAALVTAIFMRNEGNEPFPQAVPNYYRLLAIADPLVAVAAALMITAPRRRPDVRRLARIFPAAQGVAVVLLVAVAVPPTLGQAALHAAAYSDLRAFMTLHDVSEAYSEADVLLRTNLPGFLWIPVSLDFTKPILDFKAAGVPDGATVVTVGTSSCADFTGGSFSVLLRFNGSAPCAVSNPFYVP